MSDTSIIAFFRNNKEIYEDDIDGHKQNNNDVLDMINKKLKYN